MRFRAQLIEPLSLNHIVQALQKLGPQCLVTLTPTELRFYMSSEFTNGEQAFVELAVDKVFEHYRIESKKTNDEIPFQLSLDNLSRAITSGENAERIVVKLAKKQIPPRAFLSFEMRTATLNITQDVPISLQGPDRVAECQEPLLPEPTVKIRMPLLKNLRTVIDRMRSISDEVTITANNAGDLCLKVQTDTVTIKTYYKDLAIVRKSDQKPELDEKEKKDGSHDGSVNMHIKTSSESKKIITASGTMSIKKFVNILHCRSLNIHYALGCLVEERAFVLYIKLKNGIGTVTYYIPFMAAD